MRSTNRLATKQPLNGKGLQFGMRVHRMRQRMTGTISLRTTDITHAQQFSSAATRWTHLQFHRMHTRDAHGGSRLSFIIIIRAHSKLNVFVWKKMRTKIETRPRQKWFFSICCSVCSKRYSVFEIPKINAIGLGVGRMVRYVLVWPNVWLCLTDSFWMLIVWPISLLAPNWQWTNERRKKNMVPYSAVAMCAASASLETMCD